MGRKSTLNDPKLLDALCKQDREAWETLCKEIQEPLRKFFLRRLPKEDIEDSAQEVLIRAYVGIIQFNRLCYIETWIWRIASNVLADAMRSNERSRRPINDYYDVRMKYLLNILYPERVQGPDMNAMRNHDLHKISQEIEELFGKNYREIFVKHYINGLSEQEVADSMNMKLKTVSSYLARLREKLRKNSMRLARFFS